MEAPNKNLIICPGCPITWEIYISVFSDCIQGISCFVLFVGFGIFFFSGMCFEAFHLHWNEILNVYVTRSNVYLKLFFSIALTFKHSQREDRIVLEYQNLASPELSKRCVWTQLSSHLPAQNLAPKVFLIPLMLCRSLSKIWILAEAFFCALW